MPQEGLSFLYRSSASSSRLSRHRRRRLTSSLIQPGFAIARFAIEGMAKRSRKKNKQRVPSLSDDLLFDILSRVPYRSLCRFKCVSRSWLALCSDPGVRKKSPQTLSGFFCHSRDRDDDKLHFLNLSGRGRPLVDPSPPLPEGYEGPQLADCCSSLLLWKFYKLSPFDPDYLVCNPATRKWTLLPATEPRHPANFARLGFDPSTPSCFYVFMFPTKLTGLEIYSSQTGGWIFRKSEWGDETNVDIQMTSVFYNGTLYAITTDLSVVTVDIEGKTWRKIRLPHSNVQFGFIDDEPFIAHSQGHLYAMYIDFYHDNLLSVWAVEEDGNEPWTLKHSVSISELFGRQRRVKGEFYTLIAAHPERNMIFLTGGMPDEYKLMSCDLDTRQVHVICAMQEYFLSPCFPYIPCFVEWSSDGP
ncbi:hypothetical protein ACP70R_041543 [Stipagrostis hirtigluma subsp. patula]